MNSLRPVVVLGMHRSGTSALAHLLHEDGIDMGEELMPASHSNSKGHYENLKFYRFHHNMMNQKGMTYTGVGKDFDKSWDANTKIRAESLLVEHKNTNQWGWKDPRTSLFLNQWAEVWKALNLTPFFICIYRTPGLVLQSLIKRDIKDIKQHNGRLTSWLELKKYNKNIRWKQIEYLESWISHYEAIKNWILQHPTDCTIINASEQPHVYERVQALLRNRGYEIKGIDANTFYDSSLFTKEQTAMKYKNENVAEIHQFFTSKAI